MLNKMNIYLTIVLVALWVLQPLAIPRAYSKPWLFLVPIIPPVIRLNYPIGAVGFSDVLSNPKRVGFAVIDPCITDPRVFWLGSRGGVYVWVYNEYSEIVINLTTTTPLYREGLVGFPMISVGRVLCSSAEPSLSDILRIGSEVEPIIVLNYSVESIQLSAFSLTLRASLNLNNRGLETSIRIYSLNILTDNWRTTSVPLIGSNASILYVEAYVLNNSNQDGIYLDIMLQNTERRGFLALNLFDVIRATNIGAEPLNATKLDGIAIGVEFTPLEDGTAFADVKIFNFSIVFLPKNLTHRLAKALFGQLGKLTESTLTTYAIYTLTSTKVLTTTVSTYAVQIFYLNTTTTAVMWNTLLTTLTAYARKPPDLPTSASVIALSSIIGTLLGSLLYLVRRHR